ncbi:MAG: hypothetical protein OXR03_16295 [Rhodospirillaceae bacterium]|nr:hypothetical protein [Rhodospirillaceae bacterium]
MIQLSKMQGLPIVLIGVAWFLGLMLTSGRAGADTAAAAILASTCHSCHMSNAAANENAIPSLQDKSAAFLETQLLKYKQGARAGTVMNRIARGFTQQEIKLLSRYLTGRR